MPSIADKLTSAAPAARKKRAPAKRKAKARTAVKGATRKAATPQKTERAPSIWLNGLLILLGAGVVLAAAAQAYVTLDALPVQRISVSGQLEHTQAEAVQEMVQTNLAGGFLSADLQRMRTELECLPWIFEATIRRRWPNALEIHVIEQLPIARWGDNSFLNHEGGIFRSDKEIDWQSLPALKGPEGTAPAWMAKYLRLLERLSPLQLSVSALSVDERGQLQAVLGNGMQLALPNTACN